MSKRYLNSFFFALLVLIVAIPALAGPMPSKVSADQSLDARAADLAVVREFASNEQVVKALEAHGFTPDQVEQRVAQLSNDDLRQLSQNLDQLQAAGLTRQEWIWIGIGALAALILVVAVG